MSQERHLQLQQLLQIDVARLRIELQQENSKLEGHKACYEELVQLHTAGAACTDESADTAVNWFAATVAGGHWIQTC